MSKIGKQAPYLDGVPVVVSTALRDAMFPSPDTNQRVQNLETGLFERFDGSEWLPEVSTGRGSSPFNVKAYGAKGDGTTDDTAAILLAIAAMPDIECVLFFPAGTYRHTGITLTRRGLRFVGVRDGRAAQGGGSRLLYAPTAAQQLSPCSGIAIGTSGVAGDPFFDASYENGPGGVRYGGVQETYFEQISFECSPATGGDLIHTTNEYGVNTVAVRDYYGGSVQFRNCWFEKFDYPFWGVHSDFDDFDNVTVLYCNHGPYFGPRSDQLTTRNLQVNNCNDGLWLDRAQNSVHVGLRIIDCGDAAGTRFGCKMTNQYTAASVSGGHVFIAPWLEIGATNTATDIEAWFQIGGDSDAQPTRDITIIRPTIVTAPQADTPHCVYLARFGNGTRIKFDGLTNLHASLFKTFKFSHASTNAHVDVDTHDDMTPTYDNVGAATPVVAYRSSGYGESAKLGGANGRVYVTYTNQAVGYVNEYYTGSESQFGYFVIFPNRTSTGNANQILRITRAVQHATAAPTTGTWAVGDRVFNSAPSVGNPKSWVCTVAGTPGTWVSEGTL